MQLDFVIVHSLQKTGGKVGARLELSDEALDPTDSDVIDLITELNDRYRTKNQSYGTFDAGADSTKFHDELQVHLTVADEPSFITFSCNTAGELRTQMDGIPAAKGGYLVFASYTDQRNYISVFIVRDTKGLLFKKKGASFALNKIDHIDFEKMSMACRINKNLFAEKSGRYLSFINKKSDVTSLYFTRWIAAKDVETNEEDTKNLYTLFKTLPLPVDEEGKEQDRDTFLNTVYKHILSSPQKQVSVTGLSKTYYDDENFLNDEIERAGLSINTEFKAHPASLRRFSQIRAKAKGIELNFPQNLYRTVVKLNENDRNQIIINSAELAAEVAKLANE